MRKHIVRWVGQAVVVAFLTAWLGTCTPIKVEPMLDNPYQNYPHWYRGQTHTHTTASASESDDNLEFSVVIDLYAQAGYDFLAITDHNFVGTQEAGTPLVLQGCESGDAWENHLVAIGVNSCPDECASCSWGVGLPNCSVPEDQKRVDQALSQNGLVILAHPSTRSDWLCFPGSYVEQGWSTDKMKSVKGYHAVEIVSGSSLSIDEWKEVLRQGRAVWAVAADDFHKSSNLGFGWIVVNSNKNPPEKSDILENIKKGNFYAVACARGACEHWPKLERVLVLGGIVSVYGRGATVVRFIDDAGVLATQTVGGGQDQFWASYIPDDSAGIRFPKLYLRVEIEDSAGNVAYSQPLFVLKAGSSEPPEPEVCGDKEQCCGHVENGRCDGQCWPRANPCP